MKILLIACAVMLVSCGPRLDPDMGPHRVVVDTDLRDAICRGRHACAPSDEQGQYALMAVYKDLPAGRFIVTVPDDILWPPMVPKNNHDLFKQRRCGMQIAEANGMKAGWNGAGYLCHEVMHLAGFTH